MCKNGRDLELTDDSLPRNLRRRGRGDIAPVEQDDACGWHQKFGQQIKTGGLACAVRTDQGKDVAALHLQIDIDDRSKSLEFLGQVPCLKNDVGHSVSWLLIIMHLCLPHGTAWYIKAEQSDNTVYLP